MFCDREKEIDLLTDAQAGKLLKAVMRYASTGSHIAEEEELPVKILFSIIASGIDGTNEKYAKRCKKNKRIAVEREKRKREQESTNVHERTRTYTKSTDTDTDTDTDTLLRKVNINIAQSAKEPKSAKPPSDILPEWFDEVWKAYPNKKGKDKISKKSYKELIEAGKDKLLTAVQNYKTYCEKNEWYRPQYGSTFFNGTWKEYLAIEPAEPENEYAGMDFDEIFAVMREKGEVS